MEPALEPLDARQPFRFACGPGVPCFNRCCRDLNQTLYPYDVLRLARFLEMPSGPFLARFCHLHDGPRTGLPVVGLRFDAAREGACPFVTDTGCRVYPARPAACRLYPLARAVMRDAATGGLRVHYALVREGHCQGHDRGGRQRRPLEWVEDQGLEPYHEMNDPFIDVVRGMRRRGPGPLSPAERRSMALALYDADGFRRHLLAHPDRDPLTAAPGERERLARSDEALLRFAYRWVLALLGGTTDGR